MKTKKLDRKDRITITTDNLQKLPEENELEYLWRVDGLIQKGIYPNWTTITPIINKELYGDDDELYKTESAYRKKCKYARDFFEAGVFNYYKNDSYLKELEERKKELEKEKIKLQTEKIEYSRWLRADTRDELITEKILGAIQSLPPVFVPHPIPIQHSKIEGCLAFGDEHYGAEFEIKGLMNELINSYSPEIFEKRMYDLLYQTIDIIKKEKINVLHVFSMGDFSDGILRVKQLMKLRYGVIEGTIIYANFITEWLNALSKHVYIKYQMTYGNHTELRMLGQPKGTFENENMGKVVSQFIKERLKNNPNFEYIENPTGLIYENILGFNFVGFHGESKNMERTLKDFSNIYNIKIDYLIAGHLHHAKVEDISRTSSVINVPSIIGTDPYALSIDKTSAPGAALFIIEANKGKQIEYSIKLN